MRNKASRLLTNGPQMSNNLHTTRVSWLGSWLTQQVRKTWHNPRRVTGIFDAEKRSNLLRTMFSPGRWTDHSNTYVRTYRSYAQYLKHQQSKRALILRSDYEEHFRNALRERLHRNGLVRPGTAALCLGARSGAEVKAFVDCGCFAVGIDVKPTPNNQYVLFGDFQQLQWPAGCVDVVYTNALDHAYDIAAVLGEVRRVLRRAGVFVVEAVRGAGEDHPPGPWESFYWERTDDLVELLEQQGFALSRRGTFSVPWPGQHFTFMPKAAQQQSA
jgi:SAM-dependent methyltransferase